MEIELLRQLPRERVRNDAEFKALFQELKEIFEKN